MPTFNRSSYHIRTGHPNQDFSLANIRKQFVDATFESALGTISLYGWQCRIKYIGCIHSVLFFGVYVS